MDNSSVGSTSSLSSIMTDASTLKLTQLDLQLLDLSGNASGEDDKHLGKGKRYPEQTKRMLAPANSSNSAQGEGEGRQEIEKEEQEEGETIRRIHQAKLCICAPGQINWYNQPRHIGGPLIH